jgi:uncharacterized membrane protein YtjA (UPF0391 family)
VIERNVIQHDDAGRFACGSGLFSVEGSVPQCRPKLAATTAGVCSGELEGTGRLDWLLLSGAKIPKGGKDMLHYAIVFLIIAIVAGIFGFTGIAGTSAWIAHVLFVIFLVLFVVSLLFRGRPPV